MIDPRARVLLSVLQTREHGLSLPRKAAPFITGIALLFFGGYMERYLRHDSSNHALTLYLFSILCVAVGIAVASYLGTTRDILRKTVVFPLRRRSRFDFVSAGILLNTMAAAVLLSGALCVGIVYGDTLVTRTLSACTYLALMLAVHLLIAWAMLIPIGRFSAATAAGVAVVLGMLTLTGLAMLLFPAPHLPLLSWAVAGIRAAANGEVLRSCLNLGYLFSISLLLVILGRRIV